MIRYYYPLQLEDLVDIRTLNTNWKAWFISLGFNKPMTEFGFTDTEWFSEYIAPRFRDSIIAYVDKEDCEDEPTSLERFEAIKNVAYKIYSFIKETSANKKLLLDNYETKREHYLDAVKQKVKTEFKDTPQDTTDTSSPAYNSTVTDVTTDNDVGTILARLEEVRQLARNVYADWADEFERRFVIRG